MQFLISAGEASGEAHGAELIRALRACVTEAEFFGVGGSAMRAAGCDLVVNARDVAVVGLTEVVKHLPGIYRRFHQLLAAADERRPDAAILIDFPDFNFRLARQLHRRGIPVFYYISPQLWAWRRGRIELVRRYVRRMLVIFPFEHQFYADHGVRTSYVGHPLAELARPRLSREALATEAGLNADNRWIALLPGSRQREVLMNLPEMLRAATLLSSDASLKPQSGSDNCRYEFVLPVASTLDRDWLRGVLEQQEHTHGRKRTGTSATGADVPPQLPQIRLTTDARAALAHARAAIVASGTATLEAALLGTPFVMVYQVSPLTWSLGRHLVKVPHFGIVNLILGRRAVPEFVQQQFRAANVASALASLIRESPERQAQLAAFAELRQKLSAGGEEPAPCRAARIIVEELRPPGVHCDSLDGKR